MKRAQQRESKAKARKAGLFYVQDLDGGWVRRRNGRGFLYLSSRGKRIVGRRALERISRLAIPPAWKDVRICPKPNGHLQAIGVDDKGRLQYLYHDEWHAISAATKFDRLESIGGLLPKVRRRVRRDLGKRGLPRERVIAAIIRLIDKAHLRIGNPAYAEDNGSHGATTLTADHVEVDDVEISLDYPGKSGKQTEVRLADRKVAAVIQKCEEINGQFLFCYRDDDTYRPVTSSDVNGYLQEVAGESLTAKDFRTWSASVVALKHLRAALEDADGGLTKRAISRAVRETAEQMSHTQAVCRSSYIHPGLLAAAEQGVLGRLIGKSDDPEREHPAELTRDESLFLALLPELPR